MIKIAVVGTAGRGADLEKLQVNDYERMCSTVHSIINSITNTPHLVSGGAAWADHVAVNLYNRGIVNWLDLHLPVTWDNNAQMYTQGDSVINNPGRISNYYHKWFSDKVHINSLRELDLALQRCKHTASNGFFSRNNKVANVDAIIALTFGNKATLKDGGTSNTFGHYLKHIAKSGAKNISFHVDLNTWNVYTPALIR